MNNTIKNLTPEQLALLSEKLKGIAASKGRRKPIEKRANPDEHPMSSAQKRLWFLNQLNPDSSNYNMFSALRLKGALNIEALGKALNEVVKRHEILRSAYIIKENEPCQLISPLMSIKLDNYDVSYLEAPEKQSLIDKYLSEEAEKPFDISKWPLIRATLIKTDLNEYILILSMHHIIADGWSFNVLIKEFMMFYNSEFNQTKPVLPELPIQYSDYAQWQNGHIEGEAVRKQLLFWRKKLQGMPERLDLPLDNARPSVKRFEGARHYFQIPGEVKQSLLRISQETSATEYMILLSAFQVFLYRITAQEDFGIGVPIANRNRPEIENLIGFFVNTMVIRADIKSKPTFREVIKRVKEFTTEAYDNQDVPFEKVVESVQASRDISSSPLFQVMFDLQELPIRKLSVPGLRFSLADIDNKTSKVDLLLLIENDEETLRGIFEYDTAIFHRQTIESLAAAFGKLLKELAAGPDKSVEKLRLLEMADEQRLLYQINNFYGQYPKDECVHHLFEASAEKYGSRTAVIEDGGKEYSYSELNQRANKLARCLLRKGAGINIPVIVFMERSFDMIVSILAVLKTGGIYVPVDTGYPKARLSLMFEDVNSPIVLTKSYLKGLLPETNKSTVLQLDKEEAQVYSEEGTNLGNIRDLGAESLAYIIYTSGSTGIPKGVAVKHKGINRLVINTNYINITPDEKITHISNVTFDAATFEIWGALLNGASAVIIAKDDVLSTRKFIRLIKQHKITSMFITTALFNQIVSEDPDAFYMVKTLLFGGEMADVKSVQKVLGGRRPERLCNMYGPTECTTYSTYYLIESLEGIRGNIPIGGTISNSTIYVLDKNLQIVPPGVNGELYLGGEGVAEGYINRADLTAEKFIPDPFSRQKGARLYKTGDLVRYLPDGNIVFIGRIDNQIKLRGFRIELGEIESVLKEYVKDAVVLLREDIPGDKKLTAYVVAEKGSSFTLSSLRAYLSEKLPDYMIPTYFVAMESFPTNLSGKIDKHALPLPSVQQQQQQASKNFVEARTKLEKYLSGLWKEVLGLKEIGIYDNFFELGGNSIQAAVLMNRLQKQFSEEAHVKAIFLAPTVAELALYINEYYPDLTRKIFGDESSEYTRAVVEEDVEKKITQQDVEELRQIIKLPANVPAEIDVIDKKKNPRAIFILSPPRSGSTLLRVMLAGNPGLFSPPELELLSFNSLRERKEILSSQYSLWLEAAVRAVMELKGCSATEAESLMESLENSDISVKDFYGLMQQWMGGSRLLVDKTPSYSLSTDILGKAEQYFDGPLYIHLLRHPYASVYSFVEAKLDKTFFRYPHSFKSRELAELIWIISHQNIASFLEAVPVERKHILRFEDLVEHPEEELRRICSFIGVQYNADMIKPYEGRKMTDPVRENSQMVGDYKFYLRNKIDQNVTARWRKFHFQEFLSDTAWNIAEQYGYRNEDNGTVKKDNETLKKDDLRNNALRDNGSRNQLIEIKPAARDKGELTLSYAQQRLWFLDQLEPNNPFYNISAAFRLIGDFDAKALLKSLDEIVSRHEVLRTTFPTYEGKPRLKIHESLPYEYKYLELVSSAESSEEKTLEIINTESRRPFDIAEGPLLRILLIKENAETNVLVIIMHHIISDGWSMGVLFEEITHYYHSFRTGEATGLPALSVQYADYAIWQKETLKGDKLQRQSGYWIKKLDAIPKLINLPLDFTRPSVQNHKGDRLFHLIPGDKFSSIVELSNKQNVTPFMLLAAAFQLLLHKYTGQKDICLGTPVAGRNVKELESLIGFFANTVVLRGNFSKDIPFNDLLKKTYDSIIEALSHQDMPFERLVDLLQAERDMSYTPVFQVMLSHNKSPIQTTRLDNLRIVPVKIKNRVSKFDLLVEVTEKDESFKIEWEYNTELFKESTIRRMAGHFNNLIADIIRYPEKKISELQMLSKAENELLVETWNSESRKEDLLNKNEDTFPALFESQVRKTPDAAAVEFNGKSLSFNELNKKANQLAHYLNKKGVGPESFVAVCLNRSIELVTAIVGILKSGAAYIPLDPLYPKERIKTILKEIPGAFVITEKELESLFSESKNEIFLPWDGKESDFVLAEPEHDPRHKLLPENPAYMIFTSGSTGTPKGVVIQHNSLINLFKSLKEKIYSKLPEKMRISLNAPVFFDASMQQIVMLLDGHMLVILPQDVRGGGSDMLQFIQSKEIGVLDCVPSQLKLLLEAGLLETKGFKPSACLPGGEAIEPKVWNKLVSQSDIDFYNMYGPTECTVDALTCHINELNDRAVIGKPVFNTRVYILDSYLNPVPVGVQGEIYLSGLLLGRGYYKHPEMTAEKYIPCPFSQNGERMYRTGDLGRYMEDGNIEYLGRMDHQVKIRGFRIETGEIENALKNHPNVKEALVDTFEDTTSGLRRLAAYVSFRGEKPVKALSEMREFLKNNLPEYMIPSVFVFLDEMPLTSNGKIDRKRLPKAEEKRPELNEEYQRPESRVERLLAEIWREVLHVDEVGVNDNFFELGGDSIMSIQVKARANQKGLNLSSKQIFLYPTIKALAQAASEENNLVKAEQSLITGQVPLSPIQKWFFENKFAVPDEWTQANLFRIDERLDPEILKTALDEIIIYHDMLRAGYLTEDNEIKQVLSAKNKAKSFYHIELFENEAEKNENASNSQLHKEIRKIQNEFKLNEGSLIKLAYMEEKSKWYLFISAHHLIIDSVSWRILLDDLWTVYRQIKEDKKVSLPLKTTSFKSWAEKLQLYAQSENIGKKRDFWLKSTPKTPAGIPLETGSIEENTEESACMYTACLDEEATGLLQHKVQAKHDLKINEILLSAFYLTISQWTGSNDVYVDLESHGRETSFDDIDLSRTIGWFTSLYPVYLKHHSADDLKTESKKKFVKTALYVKNQMRVFAENALSFGLLKYLNAETSEEMKAVPAPEISFNYLGQFNLSKSENFSILPGINLQERNSLNRRTHILDFTSSIMDGKLILNIRYSRKLHQENSIERLSASFIDNLQRIIVSLLETEAAELSAPATGSQDFGLDQEQYENLLDELDEG